MTKTKKKGLFLVILGYILAALFYAFSTPPLEASDEYKHYPLVQYVQSHWRLPELDPEEPGLWLQEAAQPPLYYGLMALLTFPIDTSDLTAVHQVNPHAFVGNPNQIGNKNIIIHQPELEAFPWSGAILAIYLIRLASIGLGIGTIIVIYKLGILLFSPDVALLAAVLTAFNPMFLFVSAAVNNDSLAIFLGNLGLYLLSCLWLNTPDPRSAWRSYLGLGVVLGLGLLTKLSLGGLVGLAGLALAWMAIRQKKPLIFFLGGPIVLLPAILIPAAWFGRNWSLYGDLTGLGVFIAVQGSRLNPITWADWLAEFGTFYRSFWGLFGGVNVAAPEIVYHFFNLVVIVGTAAFTAWLWKRRQKLTCGGLWLLIVWPVLLFLLLVRWNIISPAFQGRLIFPALGSLTLFWAVGLLFLAQRLNVERPFAIGLPSAVFLIAILLPWNTIRPAYQHPEPLAAVPEAAVFGPFSFQAGGGEIRLVGVEVPPDQEVEPGGDKPVEVVLYWQAIEPVSENYLSTVHLLGRDYTSVGHVNRYPANGMIPTSQWQSGQIWRDIYHVYVNQNVEAPARLRIVASLYDAKQKADLPAIGPDASSTNLLVVGEARLAAGSSEEMAIDQPLIVTMADQVTFLGYALSPATTVPGDSLKLDLFWRATGIPSRDYTVFVQLLEPSGTQIAGADGPPLQGDFPTSWWREGDQIVDTHLIQIPADAGPGHYMIAIGLYDPNTGQRVSRLDEPGDMIMLPVTIQ